MRRTRNTIMSASILLAVSMGAANLSLAAAQGEEAEVAQEEGEVFTDDAGFVPETETADGDGTVVACETEEDCAEAEAPTEVVEAEVAPDAETAPEAAPAESDEAGLAAPAAAQDAVASDGAVLAAPGSTEESNGGGSSRPGTTPDT